MKFSVPRWAVVAAWSAVATLLVSVVWPEAIDFRVYWEAANYVSSGGRKLYGEFFSVGLPFTYPPFALLLFIPGGELAAPVGLFTLRFVSLLIFAEVCWFAGKALPQSYRPRFVGAWWLLPVSLLAMSSPVRETLDKGQINLVLLGVCVVALVKLEGFWGGFVIGLAGGVKLTPLALGIIYLKRRDWGAVVGMGVGLSTSVLLGFVLLPTASMNFWTSVVRDSNRVGNPGYVGNASLLGVLERLPIDSEFAPWLWLALALLVVAAGYVLIPAGRDASASVTATGIGATVMLLISPITWTHHWVWLPVMAAAWLNATQPLAKRRRLVARGLWLVAGTIAILGPLEIAHLAGFSGNEMSWNVIALGSMLPTAATVAMLCTAWADMKPRFAGPVGVD